VAHAVLRRTPTGWRTTVAESPDKITHGSLLLSLPFDSLDLAAAEFEGTLRLVWGVDGPVVWRETGRDSWTARLGSVPLLSPEADESDPEVAGA
jgi:hypothetical protein